jgi:tetratricopeptide (TPR) repeat protein
MFDFKSMCNCTSLRYEEAEQLFKRALAILEKAHGPNHPDVAKVMDMLARFYENRGRYADAELLYEHSLAISEKALGSAQRNPTTGNEMPKQ